MKNIRGWIGLLILILGIVMLMFEKTKGSSWLLLGFGVGMMSSGFSG